MGATDDKKETVLPEESFDKLQEILLENLSKETFMIIEKIFEETFSGDMNDSQVSLGEFFKLVEEAAMVHYDLGTKLAAMVCVLYELTPEQIQGVSEKYSKALTESLLSYSLDSSKDSLKTELEEVLTQSLTTVH